MKILNNRLKSIFNYIKFANFNFESYRHKIKTFILNLNIYIYKISLKKFIKIFKFQVS